MAPESFMDQDKFLEKINRLLPNTVYIFDIIERKMVWLNERGLELYGYTVQDLQMMGAEYLALSMHPEDLPGVEAALQQAPSLADGEVLNLEYRFKDRSGQYHRIKDQVTSFARGENGLVHYVFGIATNLEDRKAYEETLEKTIDKLNLCLAAGKMGTWEWDIKKNILYWDPRMYSLHGVPMDPSLSPVHEVNVRMFPEDAPEVNERVATAVREHTDFYTTYRIRYDNEEIHHVKCYGKFTNKDDKRMFGVAWDETQEIQTEQQMAEARAKMISAAKMAALGEMSAGIAHEINNPLTVIQARAFQLTQMVENDKLDIETIKQAADSINRTADKIARIIRSLRSFAREGTLEPFEIVPIKTIIDETLEFCKTRFFHHGIEIEIAPYDEDLEMECRLVQLEQVLLNLLNNSFDAIETLPEKWIRIHVTHDDHNLEISVIDSGAGIAKDIADKMMLPFFTTKEVGKGTGLGLSISSGILRSHKGELTLEPTAKNTTFKMKLPLWQQNI